MAEQTKCVVCGKPMIHGGTLHAAVQIQLYGKHPDIEQAKREYGVTDTVMICTCCTLKAYGVPKVPQPEAKPVAPAEPKQDEAFLT